MNPCEELCPECTRMNPVAILTGNPRGVKGETFSIARRSDCPFCDLCVRALNTSRSSAGKPALEEPFLVTIRWEQVLGRETASFAHDTEEVNWLRVLVGKDTRPSLTPLSQLLLPPGTYTDTAPDSIVVQVLGTPDSCISDEHCFSKGREVADYIDLGLLRYWMSLCVGVHEGCESPPIGSNLPKYLIDVSSLMLVDGRNRNRYAALSYVWGNPQVPQLKLKDLKELAPNQSSWFICAYWTKVPQTIKDAILLCQSLSIPYLWVDALCVEHDRPSHSALCDTHLARQMGCIYESAYLTIVAAAGTDSWAGLPGIRSGSRKSKQHIVCCRGRALANMVPDTNTAVKSSMWNTRAWTLQESLLSNRLLIFTENQCFWTCNRRGSTFAEGVHAEVKPSNLDIGPMLLTNAGLNIYLGIRSVKQNLLGNPGLNKIGKFWAYSTIVEDYTSRNLTYQQDALDAFGGAEHFLNREISTEFVSGLPVRFFEQALLFNLYIDNDSCLTRRPEFPSWSWAGWCHESNNQNKGIWHSRWLGRGDFSSINAWHHCKRLIEGNNAEFQALDGIENIRDDEVVMDRSRPRMYRIPPNINPLHVLLFDAEVACLDIRCHYDNTKEDGNQVRIYIPGTDQLVGTVRHNTVWKQYQTSQFVAIAREFPKRGIGVAMNLTQIVHEKEVIHTLLIETDPRGISERRHPFTLLKSNWDKANPGRRTIILV